MSGADDAPGPLIGTGRAADVFDIGDGKVLRRNRTGEATEYEAAVMQHLFAHGFPVPEVFASAGPDLVMERIDGPTMLDAFAGKPWKLAGWAEMLASLHQQLELVPLPDFELHPGVGVPEVMAHGDFHPDNVMLTDRGPIVIDWPNTRIAALGADVAQTWIITATSEIDATGLGGLLQSAGRSLFLSRFLRHAGRDRARPLLPEVAEHRLLDRNLRPSEADNISRLLAAEGFGE